MKSALSGVQMNECDMLFMHISVNADAVLWDLTSSVSRLPETLYMFFTIHSFISLALLICTPGVFLSS